MKMRTLVIAAAITAALAPAFAIAKGNPHTPGLNGTARAGSPDGVATSNYIVDLSGLSTIGLCGNASTPGAGNTVLSLNLGKNAVVTGLGGVGSYTSHGASWQSEVEIWYRGNDPTQTVYLSFAAPNAPGTYNFNVPLIDLTANALANITTGASGLFTIELCEAFDDAGIDATFGPGSTLEVAYYVPAVPAPAMSTWSLLAMLLGFGLVGGLAVRRFS